MSFNTSIIEFLEKSKAGFLKLAFLLSMFSFIGFNAQVHSPLQQTFKTEVFDSRKSRTSQKSRKSSRNLAILFYSSSFKSLEFFNVFKVIYQNQLFKTERRTMINKYCPVFRLNPVFFKTPSNLSEEAPFI